MEEVAVLPNAQTNIENKANEETGDNVLLRTCTLCHSLF